MDWLCVELTSLGTAQSKCWGELRPTAAGMLTCFPALRSWPQVRSLFTKEPMTDAENFSAIKQMLSRYRGAALAVRPTGGVIGFNDLALQILALDEAIGVNWWKAAREPDRDALARAWVEGVAKAEPFELVVTSSLAAFASPVLAFHNETGWLLTFETSEEGVPTSLRLSPEQFSKPALKTALKAAHLGLWEWDPSTDRAHWSAELYDLLRLPRGTGSEPGKRFMEMVLEQDQLVVDEITDAIERAGSYAPKKLRIKAGDGSIRWLVSCGQLAQSNGRTLVVGVNLDITDSVEAAERLSLAQAERDRQRNIVQSVLEHVPAGIAFTLKGDEELSLVSRYGLNMIERSVSDGRQWDAWNVYHTDGKSVATKDEMALYRAAQGEVIRNEEWLIRRSDGHLLPVCCDAGPILGVDGEVVGGVVAWYDVTPFKDADRKTKSALQAEQDARAAAEEANKQKDLFIGVISHELRTPLSAILGWIHAIEKNQTASTNDRGLAAINRNAKALARLVDDLLDVTRMSVGKLDVHLQLVELNEVLASTVESVKGLADAAEVTVHWEKCPQQMLVNADPLRLQQAVWNLLSNAVKFSPPGGLVLLSCAARSCQVEVEVTDYGKGLSPEHLKSVFEQFWQAGREETRKGGLGLGLALAKYIAERHGGRISVKSDGLGRGSTFILSLPLGESLEARSVDSV
jgi:signal transduction histidine kinase